MARMNRVITITQNAPVNFATGDQTTDGIPVYARRVFAQMVTGGSKLGYVFDGVKNQRIPSIANASDVTAELSAATALGPGGSYSDSDPSGGINIKEMWGDGGNTGDKMRVSWEPA